MAQEPDFDLQAAHKYFSAWCFNHAWDLIAKPNRTPAEDEEMLNLGLASLWHWTQRKDHTLVNLSVGYWQVSRIYALLGQAENSRKYGRLSLDILQGEEVLPFYVGYAYEALARAEAVAGNQAKMEEYLKKARRVAEILPDPEDKKQLLDDLATIQ